MPIHEALVSTTEIAPDAEPVPANCLVHTAKVNATGPVASDAIDHPAGAVVSAVALFCESKATARELGAVELNDSDVCVVPEPFDEVRLLVPTPAGSAPVNRTI